MLHEISNLLVETGDVASVMDQVLDRVIRFTQADRGYILLHNDQEGTFEVAAACHSDGGPSLSDAVPAGHILIDRALETGNVLSIEDVAADEQFQEFLDDNEDLASILVAPLQIDAQAKGIIYIESHLREAFSTREARFLKAVANQLAMAVDNERLRQAVTIANRAKNEYISLVTHQLRVPLTSISGYSDMILNGMVGPLTERQEGFLETIKRNVDRMSELVGGLSDINRLETGRMKMEVIDFDIAILLDEVIAQLQEKIDARHQDLRVTVAPELPPVHADRNLIGRVFNNLISNSSNFSLEGGSINISVQLDDSQALAKVSDDGIGISEEDQRQLFTPFFRSEDEVVRQVTGWGLGLAVAQKIVEAQGGELSFQSQLGHGSTFFFTLPLAVGEPFDVL
ncbi:MAG: ATP-binding protein [Chloroflexota bacterium]